MRNIYMGITHQYTQKRMAHISFMGSEFTRLKSLFAVPLSFADNNFKNLLEIKITDNSLFYIFLLTFSSTSISNNETKYKTNESYLLNMQKQ